MRFAAASNSSRFTQIRPLGTGICADSKSSLVSSLSQAISTAMLLVELATVACILF